MTKLGILGTLLAGIFSAPLAGDRHPHAKEEAFRTAKPEVEKYIAVQADSALGQMEKPKFAFDKITPTPPIGIKSPWTPAQDDTKVQLSNIERFLPLS
ncbi:hypothetical protein O9G_005839, partial [Rozella allomycis CSF55]